MNKQKLIAWLTYPFLLAFALWLLGAPAWAIFGVWSVSMDAAGVILFLNAKL